MGNRYSKYVNTEELKNAREKKDSLIEICQE